MASFDLGSDNVVYDTPKCKPFFVLVCKYKLVLPLGKLKFTTSEAKPTVNKR